MALTMVLGLTACGSGNAAPPAENADSQAADNVQEETTEAGTEASAEGAGTVRGTDTGLKIGLAVQTLSNQVWAQQAERIQADAKEGGNEVTVVDCNGNANTQINQLENFISSGVDAIIVNPVDPEAIEEVCKEARSAGIMVMSWDWRIVSIAFRPSVVSIAGWFATTVAPGASSASLSRMPSSLCFRIGVCG